MLRVTCPRPELDQNLAVQVITFIKNLKGGPELLADALKDGDITVRLAAIIPVQDHKASWDAANRFINLQINIPSQEEFGKFSQEEQTKFTKTLVNMMMALVFELCNAANPLLAKPSAKKPALSFTSREEYARDMEFREFKSNQRNLRILQDTYGNEQPVKVYKDDEFELDWIEVNKINPVTNKCHADHYREAYDEQFNSYNDKINSAFTTIMSFKVLPPPNMPVVNPEIPLKTRLFAELTFQTVFAGNIKLNIDTCNNLMSFCHATQKMISELKAVSCEIVLLRLRVDVLEKLLEQTFGNINTLLTRLNEDLKTEQQFIETTKRSIEQLSATEPNISSMLTLGFINNANQPQDPNNVMCSSASNNRGNV